MRINGVDTPIFKDPKTDTSGKKSAKGLLRVWKDEKGEFVLHDNCTWAEEEDSYLETVFEDGRLVKEYTLEEIRNTIRQVGS